MKGKLFFFILVCVILLPTLTTSAFAANTIIKTSPSNGLYTVGTAFPIAVAIDGQSDIFNAAQATVAISNNLLVKDITLGDCNFSFVTTPTTTNPSFTGVILGGSTKSCTVYTMNVLPISVGTGTITFSKAAVKSYPQAQDALLAAQNSQFTINQNAQGKTIITVAPSIPVEQSTQADTYTLLLKTATTDQKPLSGVTVILDPSEKTRNTTEITPMPQSKISTTASDGTVQFANVPAGIHTAVVMDQKTKLAQTILNVNGTNHTMTLGIMVAKQPTKDNSLPIFFIVSIVLIVLFVAFLLWWYHIKVKKATTYNVSIAAKPHPEV